MNSLAVTFALLMSIAISTVAANRNVVVYWGQEGNSKEGALRTFCTDSSIDILVISFVYDFPTSGSSGLPGINIAGHCNNAFDNSKPNFLNCQNDVGPDITFCQQQGKKVFLSFGGADGNYGFTSNAQAQTFADTVWNMFLGGSYANRPFGTAIIDGIDLDIEHGTTTGYAAFITQLRTHFTAQSARQYYISGAPQCPSPDDWLGPGAGTALGTAWFDYVWVQFYNNYCGVNAYPSKFNFDTWASWATTTSINKNVQILIGAPASAAAAGTGYVNAATLQTISNAVAASHPTVYGGIMLWDAGQSRLNNNFAGQLAAFLHTGSASPTPSTPSTPSTPTTPTTPSGTGTKSTTTTGKSSTTTTGRASTTTTGKTSASTGAATGPATGPCSTVGHMICATSETYQICDRNIWSAPLSCNVGLTCTPSGNFIYCT